MNTPSNALPEAPAQPVAPVRPFYWSVRRELWENRWLYIAPLIVAGVALLGFLWGSRHLPEKLRSAAAQDPTVKHALLVASYDYIAIILIVVTVFVGAYYCLEALHGERRDRSILFWKSLPVSDLTTVLSKATVPFAVLPVIAFGVIIATQVAMLLLSTLIQLATGQSPALLWAQVPIFRDLGVLIYGLVTLTLWYAPIYAWLLLVSAWAQRAALLWAVLPPLVIGVIERIAFHTTYVGALLRSRLAGGYAHAFVVKAKETAAAAGTAGAGGGVPHDMTQVFNPIPDPVKFVTSPAVWIGLAAAVALIALTVWLRRRRDPI
jgi:ABC-2 type transport system permease protein